MGLARPEHWTATTKASYTNYRYWPELLSGGILPSDIANRLVNARLTGGGQFCGMTRFEDHLDDWLSGWFSVLPTERILTSDYYIGILILRYRDISIYEYLNGEFSNADHWILDVGGRHV